VRIIKRLRETGSATPEELISDMPRRTFYRAVGALRDAGVVVVEDGVYRWYESAADRMYGSPFEVEQALKHSTVVAAAIQALMKEGFAYSTEKDAQALKYSEEALAHLRTGYRRLYDDYGEARRIKAEIGEAEAMFVEDVRARLIAAVPELSTVDVVAENVLRDIKEALRGHDPSFLMNLEVKGDEVWSNPRILGTKELAEPLRRVISREEQSTANRERLSKIVALENEYYALRLRLEKEASVLLMQVENGTPLKGSCPICPRVKIG
jgi:DNA-binding transcriptional ArsR family regulator